MEAEDFCDIHLLPTSNPPSRRIRNFVHLLTNNSLNPAKDSSQREKIAYICGLRARIECEPGGEHSTRSDRVTNIGYLLSLGASLLPIAIIIYLRNSCFRHKSLLR